jgi:putative ABC transport system ATP-binding protein
MSGQDVQRPGAQAAGPGPAARPLDRPTVAVVAAGLSRVYRRGAERINALKGIDLTIAAGEFVAIVGRSGSGKTTLLNLLGLMDRPTAGSLRVLGADVTGRGRRFDSLRRDNIGFVFQEFYLLAGLTALENVLVPALWSGSAGRVRRRAVELLELVGLGHRISHRPAELSGGEMQRVAVARALVNSPKLLLADEPTGNLDTKTRDEVISLLTRLNRDSGLSVVLATHDLSLESRFSRVIHLEDGVAG